MRRQNFLYLSINQNFWSTGDASMRGVTIDGAPDRRVAVTNAGRATRSGIPTYSATGQMAVQVLDQIVEDRGRELCLEEHRVGDICRLGLRWLPVAGTPYPGGGGTCGDPTCFPLPDAERINNTNLASSS